MSKKGQIDPAKYHGRNLIGNKLLQDYELIDKNRNLQKNLVNILGSIQRKSRDDG